MAARLARNPSRIANKARADHARGSHIRVVLKSMTSVRITLLVAALGFLQPAQAGWFDWFTPGEWATGVGEFFGSDQEARGFYVGGGAGVLRANWGLQRRIGGVDDPTADNLKYQAEPAILTVANLRAGWEPFTWLAIEGEWGFDIDKSEISENPRQVAELDSLSGIFLRPQLPIGKANLFVEAGFNQLHINMQCERDSRNRNNNVDEDPQLSQSCRDFDDSGFAYGAGVSFNLSEKARLQFSWRQVYDDDFEEDGSNDVATSLMISVSSSFGGGSDDDDYY